MWRLLALAVMIVALFIFLYPAIIAASTAHKAPSDRVPEGREDDTTTASAGRFAKYSPATA